MRSSPGPMTLMVVVESVAGELWLLLFIRLALPPISSAISPESSEEKSDSMCDASGVKSTITINKRCKVRIQYNNRNTLNHQHFSTGVFQNKGELTVSKGRDGCRVSIALHSPAVPGEEAFDWFLLPGGVQIVHFSKSFHSPWCFSSM